MLTSKCRCIDIVVPADPENGGQWAAVLFYTDAAAIYYIRYDHLLSGCCCCCYCRFLLLLLFHVIGHLSIFGHIQGFIDHLGDGFDFRPQLLLDAVKGEPENTNRQSKHASLCFPCHWVAVPMYNKATLQTWGVEWSQPFLHDVRKNTKRIHVILSHHTSLDTITKPTECHHTTFSAKLLHMYYCK